MFADIKNLLSFAAFRPERDDRKAPWAKRFARERALMINAGRTRTSWRGWTRGGVFREGGVQSGDFKEIAAGLASDWRSLTDDGWCCLSINSRYVISLEPNVSRKPGADELLRTNPRAVLGTRFERGKRYALTNNPESPSSILLTVDEEQIKSFETSLKEIGLRPARIAVGTYAMLRRLLSTVHRSEEKPGTKSGKWHASALDIVCCDGSVCAMLESDNHWTELRSRTDLYTPEDFEPVFEILKPLISRLEEESEIRFTADSANNPVLEALRTRLPQANINDLSGEDHLWKVLGDL